MNHAQQLIALRNRKPDSIAPDGAPLMFLPVREVSRFIERGKSLEIAFFDRITSPTSEAGETLSSPSPAAERARSHTGTLGTPSSNQRSENARGCIANRDDFVVPHAGVHSRRGQ